MSVVIVDEATKAKLLAAGRARRSATKPGT
jgi:hypothetical protein